jgi:hypothetical protein
MNIRTKDIETIGYSDQCDGSDAVEDLQVQGVGAAEVQRALDGG